MAEGSLESRIEELGADRERGASALARSAVAILADTPPAERNIMAERLAALRPSMPAIAAVVRDGASRAAPLTLLDEIDADHERVAAVAGAAISRELVVATISHSSLVERVLLSARPRLIEVRLAGRGDEGQTLMAELRDAGIEATPAPPRLTADIGLCGCDAMFADGGFVNRRGTADLLADLGDRPLLVVGDRWRQVPGPTPRTWPQPELFEPVPAAANVRLVF